MSIRHGTCGKKNFNHPNNVKQLDYGLMILSHIEIESE